MKYSDKLKNICEKLNVNDYVVHFEKAKKTLSRQIQNRLQHIMNQVFNESIEVLSIH